MGAHASARPDPNGDAEAVLVALRRLVRFIRLAERGSEHVAGGPPLSAAQQFVLHVLAERPAASLAEVAARTLTDQSSVSTVVAKLVERKLVARATSRTDRRRAELTLTAAGVRAAAAAPRLPQIAIVDAVRAMPAPRRGELVAALDHLVTAVGADAVAPRMFDADV